MKKLLFTLLFFIPSLALASELCTLPPIKVKTIDITNKINDSTQLFFDNYRLTIAKPEKVILGVPEIFYFNNDKKISLQPVPSKENSQTQSFYNQAFGLSAIDNKQVNKEIVAIRNMLDIDCKKSLKQYKLSNMGTTIIRTDPTIAGTKPAYIYLYGKNDSMYLIEFYGFSDKEIESTLSTLILR